MIKKDVTYENLDGEMVTETFYFNFSKVELLELEVSGPGGSYAENLQKKVGSGDKLEILSLFKDLIRRSIGRRTEDGKRFVKDPIWSEEFVTTEAYSELVFGLISDTDSATAFLMGLMPKGLVDESLSEEALVQKAKDLVALEMAKDTEYQAQHGTAAPETIERPENPYASQA